MFGADISPSANIDNNKKYILIGKGPAYGLNNTALTAEKEFFISFTEQQKKLCLCLHYSEMNNYIFVNGVEVYKFKAKYSEINATLFC